MQPSTMGPLHGSPFLKPVIIGDSVCTVDDAHYGGWMIVALYMPPDPLILQLLANQSS